MFNSQVFGKWILSGEHAVLRGGSALVFPVSSCYLKVDMRETSQKLQVSCESEQGEQLGMVFMGLLDKALADVGRERADFHGDIHLVNTIPLVGGMGASAALCVSVSKVLHHWGLITEDKIFQFSKNLEDLFHGESSGVDVAACLQARPLIYRTPGEFLPFEPKWKPHLYLSHCGKRGVTADCIRKVKKLWETNESLGQSIDWDMKRSAEMAQMALLRENALENIQQAILLARSCFERWGLVSPELSEHMNQLHKHGALATKPTGSGEGGFVLSLWERKPENVPLELLEC